MDAFDGDGAWSWERLLAHDESVLDAPWAELMQQHWRATEVPLERPGTVLDVGINSYVRTARLNTSKLAVIFNRGLGVCLVCKNFLAYRDAFLYGLGLAWGIEVPNVELSQPLSKAAFELYASLQELERRAGQGVHGAGGDNSGSAAGPSGTQPAYSHGDNGGHSDKASDKVRWNVLTASAARSMRRRPGATRWTIKICRAQEQELNNHAAESEAEPSALARKVWKIVMDCDVTGADELKDKARERRRKEKKREKRQRRKERKLRGKGKRRDSNSDSNDSSSSSSNNSSSSGSSSSSSRRSSRARKKQTGNTARRAGNDIAGRKEGEIWRGTGSAANTEFTLLGRRRHFKSKRSGAWEDCKDPPKTKCTDCGHAHWYFDKDEWGCVKGKGTK